VLLLILDSLGSTELLFILVMALIFFGPRKLPQISRSLGKSIAEFRKASEDFKRTWEREVALESPPADPVIEHSSFNENYSVNEPEFAHDSSDHRLEPVPVQDSISRQNVPTAEPVLSTETDQDLREKPLTSDRQPKHDWF
jgi:TatA/E family protein of Tat protein translocase